jgi:ABC-type lipoprotein release transport system permease subunit
MVLAIRPWSTELGGTLFPSRMATVSLGVLGMMGAMLSITGIFGMAAYSVSKRLKELGIRMALGAKKKEVLQAALGRPLKLLVFGSGVGLVLGLLATKVLAFIVYQATPRDPLVLGGVVLAMAALGLLATWIPALRALSVNPLVLLREESVSRGALSQVSTLELVRDTAIRSRFGLIAWGRTCGSAPLGCVRSRVPGAPTLS